jgi:Protein of unknown function (DUF3105)
MVSGKNSKATRNARASVVTRRSTPWGTIAAVAVVVLFAAGIFGYAFVQNRATSEAKAALAKWTPSASNQDPSLQIPGIVNQDYAGGQHVTPDRQVAYTHSPPFGGAHDGYWAACNGVIYPQAVRTENLVHSMEHGAVWIAYNPDQVSGDALSTLESKVDGERYMVMSPYPGLDSPVSLQSWGHQLKVNDVNDPRIDEFVSSLKQNQYTHPEVGASCDATGPQGFDQDNPPAFVAPPAPGTPGAQPEASAAPQSVAPDPAPAQ